MKKKFSVGSKPLNMPDRSEQIRTMNDGEWCWVGKEVIREQVRDIRPLGLAVYLVLASLVDPKQRCYPSQGYIAQRLGTRARASIRLSSGCER